MFDRWYAGTLETKLARPYVHLIFGARQTGKSTLLRALLPPDTLVMDPAEPADGGGGQWQRAGGGAAEAGVRV